MERGFAGCWRHAGDRFEPIANDIISEEQYRAAGKTHLAYSFDPLFLQEFDNIVFGETDATSDFNKWEASPLLQASHSRSRNSQ